MEQPVRQIPQAMKAITESFNAGESFIHIFSGVATSDYVRPGATLVQYLTNQFAPRTEVTVTYSLSGGIRFAASHMRARYFAIMGATDDEPQAESIMVAPEPAIADLLKLVRTAGHKKACVIVERLDDIAGTKVQLEPSVISLMEMLHEAGTDNSMVSQGNPFLMLTPMHISKIHRDLYANNSGIKLTAIDKPNTQQRKRFFVARLEAEAQPINMADGLTADEVANKSAGLLRRHLETIIMRARVNNLTLTREIVADVQREQMEIEFGHVLKRVDKPYRLTDLGGSAEMKALAMKRLVKPLREGNYLGAGNLLMVGPPGTGKTMGAAAIANETGLNCLEVDLSLLLNDHVGGTEGNVAELKAGLLENAPCLAIMDEIDQKVRRGTGGGGDSGGGGAVENRLFASVLEIFSDPNMQAAGVYGVFMSNLPKQLDKAFMSRMAYVVPMLPPATDAARAEVLAALVNRFSGSPVKVTGSEQWMIDLAGKVINWSGRDLEQVVRESIENAKLDGVSLADALAETIEYRVVNVADVTDQVVQALQVTKDRRLIPEAYRDALAKANQPKRWNDVPGKTQAARQSTSLDVEAEEV